MASDTDVPEWVPEEYNVADPLAERLPIMADIDGGIELHVQGCDGVIEVVGAPQHFSKGPNGLRLCCGHAVDEWRWEILVRSADDQPPRLEKVNPHQDIEEYQRSKQTHLVGIDVRIYGVDSERLDEEPTPA